MDVAVGLSGSFATPKPEAPTLKKSSTNAGGPSECGRNCKCTDDTVLCRARCQNPAVQETGAGQAAEGFGDKQRPQSFLPRSCGSIAFNGRVEFQLPRTAKAARNQCCRCKQRQLSSCKAEGFDAF